MHDFLDKTSHAKAPTIELTISPPKKGVRFDSNEGRIVEACLLFYS